MKDSFACQSFKLLCRSAVVFPLVVLFTDMQMFKEIRSLLIAEKKNEHVFFSAYSRNVSIFALCKEILDCLCLANFSWMAYERISSSVYLIGPVGIQLNDKHSFRRPS